MKEYQSQEAVKEYFDKFHKPMTTQQSTVEERLQSIAIDMWANINESLQKHGVKYKGDGIGTAYGGWTAMNEIFIPRVKELLQLAEQKAREEEMERIKSKLVEYKDKGFEFETAIYSACVPDIKDLSPTKDLC